jgi:hypothetical protein
MLDLQAVAERDLDGVNVLARGRWLGRLRSFLLLLGDSHIDASLIVDLLASPPDLLAEFFVRSAGRIELRR